MDERDITPIGNTEWLKDVALVDSIECEVAECHIEAAYSIQFKCCGEVFIACNEHSHALLHKVQTFGKRRTMVSCGRCRQAVNPYDYLNRPVKLRS